MEGYVRVDEFMNHLTEQGMVIAKRELVMSQKDYAMHELKMLQEKALRKKWLSYSEIIKAQLLPYTSRTGLIAALQKRTDYDRVVMPIRGVTKVLTAAVKQMRDE